MTMRHCPRCLGRTRSLVELFSSPLPAAVLYADSVAARERRRDEPAGRHITRNSGKPMQSENGGRVSGHAHAGLGSRRAGIATRGNA